MKSYFTLWTTGPLDPGLHQCQTPPGYAKRRDQTFESLQKAHERREALQGKNKDLHIEITPHGPP